MDNGYNNTISTSRGSSGGNSGLGIATGVVGIVGLVLSIIGCCCTPAMFGGIIVGVVAIILGVVTKNNEGELTGFAKVGFILGIVAAAIGALALVIWILGLIFNFSLSGLTSQYLNY